ncbi:branched-chain amino acid ABC transporter permease [Rhodoglobus aureus]|uniref:Branched-chain amino acid ABC transporter permease n=1 Tax=Rhodoglobus aureus TaxID=191497 RepID=A0ABN1VKK7_9MICO
MTNSTRIRGLFETPVLLVAIVGLVALVALFGDPTITRVTVQALIAVVFVTGLSLFSGNSGVMSFGHVGFMAIGAYTTAYLTIPVNLKSSMFSDLPESLGFLATIHAPFPIAVLVGGLSAAALALVTAPIMARLGGLQAGIATLALLVIVFTVLNSWTDVTRGSSSMIGLPKATTIWWAAGIAALVIVIAWAYKKSRSGLQLQASREDYLAATASGIAVGRHRVFAWVLSSIPAGFAGALYAGYLTTFNSRTFFLSLTFSFIVMIVLGGYLSLSGAVIGALGVSVLQEILRRFQDGAFTGGNSLPAGIADLILAAVLLFVLVKAPLGLMGTRELRLFRKRSIGSAL